MRRPLAFCLLALLLLTAAEAKAEACGAAGAPCQVALGSYQAQLPAGWDGERPLGLLLYFHGYGGTGEAVLQNQGLMRVAADRGLLLVAPNGIPGRPGGRTSWAHVGSPSQARDELAFVDQVMADVAARWPLDRARLYAAGFSQGGSMVWDLACYRGGDFTAFFPVAGAFWDPLPDGCPTGPVALRHIHGTGDTVVPLDGRPIGERWHQGDVMQALAIRRAADGCPVQPDEAETDGLLHCRLWTRCSGGKPLELCLHPGGHAIRAEWLGEGIDRMETEMQPSAPKP